MKAKKTKELDGKPTKTEKKKKIELGFLSKHLIYLDKNAFKKDLRE